MAYRHGDRNQMQLLPPNIEEYVTPDDSVRAYSAFVDSLSLDELGILWDEHKVGNSEYNPKAMIKLLVYGYSYGLRSSRKLEMATYHNLSFIWSYGSKFGLMGGLIEGNTLFVDGSKMRANASIGNTRTPDRCERYLKKIDQHIESILTECDTIDEQEQDHPSLVKLSEELKDKERLKSSPASGGIERTPRTRKGINKHHRSGLC